MQRRTNIDVGHGFCVHRELLKEIIIYLYLFVNLKFVEYIKCFVIC